MPDRSIVACSANRSGMALATLSAGLQVLPNAAQAQRDRLARVLGLKDAEVAWLATTSSASERSMLLAALDARRAIASP